MIIFKRVSKWFSPRYYFVESQGAKGTDIWIHQKHLIGAASIVAHLHNGSDRVKLLCVFEHLNKGVAYNLRRGAKIVKFVRENITEDFITV